MSNEVVPVFVKRPITDTTGETPASEVQGVWNGAFDGCCPLNVYQELDVAKVNGGMAMTWDAPGNTTESRIWFLKCLTGFRCLQILRGGHHKRRDYRLLGARAAQYYRQEMTEPAVDNLNWEAKRGWDASGNTLRKTRSRTPGGPAMLFHTRNQGVSTTSSKRALAGDKAVAHPTAGTPAIRRPNWKLTFAATLAKPAALAGGHRKTNQRGGHWRKTLNVSNKLGSPTWVAGSSPEM